VAQHLAAAGIDPDDDGSYDTVTIEDE
jgi:hypothetical protein